MTNSDDYWVQRAIDDANHRTEVTNAYLIYIKNAYRRASKSIQKEINAWYTRYATENGMSLADAKKQLSAGELAEFKWSVEEYIEKAQEGSVWAKELERASVRVHISRLEALKTQIHAELGLLGETTEKSIGEFLADTYREQYYRSVFDVFQGTGVGFSFADVDTRKVNIALQRPWAYPEGNFSTRIWSNQAKLVNTLDTELTQMVITGEKADTVVERVASKMDTSMTNASRLVQTEEAHISQMARKECHEELDIDIYQFVCTLDERTCPVCGAMDGKSFKESERQEGINCAPMHPWCRCTDAPYYDDMEIGTRTARIGEGKTYRVPADMTYEQWYKENVKGR